MDWSKAKTILIVVLLVANIFLLYLYIGYEKMPTEDVLEKETIALLESKQIYVKADLPQGNQKMPVLVVEYDRTDEELIQRAIEGQTGLANYSGTMEEDIEISLAFLEKCGLFYESVTFHDYKQENSISAVYYINEYEGIKVEDSYMECIISEGKVIGLERFWLKPVGRGKAKKATISPSAALIELMRKKHTEESIFVESIEMIYWLDPTFPAGETAVSDTALPTWKIEYNKGLCKYVPAYID